MQKVVDQGYQFQSCGMNGCDYSPGNITSSGISMTNIERIYKDKLKLLLKGNSKLV